MTACIVSVADIAMHIFVIWLVKINMFSLFEL